MQKLKVLQRPLHVLKDARRCNRPCERDLAYRPASSTDIGR